MIAIADLHWAAGLLEGEGYFSASKKGAECVQVAQVNSEPLAKLRKLFGGNIGYAPAQSEKSRDYFRWGLGGTRARGVMMTLFPLLSELRQEQIRAALLVKVGPLQLQYQHSLD